MSLMIQNRARLLTPLARLAQRQWDLTTRLPSPRWGALRVVAELLNRLLVELQKQIMKIARAGVQVSQAAPELASLSRELEAGSRDQAARAGHIARASQQLAEAVHDIANNTRQAAAYSDQVARITGELHSDSRNLGEIVALISRVAEQTKLLSINAAVEAARAGEAGASFAVVASEVQNLAEQTMSATNRVADILNGIRRGVGDLVRAVGGDESGGDQAARQSLHGLLKGIAAAASGQDDQVGRVSADIQAVAAVAQQQSAGAEQLSRLGESLRHDSETLLTSLGEFRFSAHARARDLVEEMARSQEMTALRRLRMESFLRNMAARHPFLELLYVTDAQGRQVTSNISSGRLDAARGGDAHGRDWSRRPWFLGAMDSGDTFVSDLYRSVATDNFCFTVSTPLWDDEGAVMGVLAADVHFADIL